MRSFLLWSTALLFLLVALYTVTVRHEVYAEARRIGRLEEQLREQSKRNDNLALSWERLASPAALDLRARNEGLVEGDSGR